MHQAATHGAEDTETPYRRAPADSPRRQGSSWFPIWHSFLGEVNLERTILEQDAESRLVKNTFSASDGT